VSRTEDFEYPKQLVGCQPIRRRSGQPVKRLLDRYVGARAGNILA